MSGSDKDDYLQDVDRAMKDLEARLKGRARTFARLYGVLQKIIDQAGAWMGPADLRTLRDRVKEEGEALDQDLEMALERLRRLSWSIDEVIDRKRHTRGCVLDPIEPIKPIRRPGMSGGDEGTGTSPEPVADVIFVHGLDGNAYSTWQSDRRQPLYSWPYWLAEEFPHVKVWTLGYPAASRDRNGKQGLALEIIAKESLNALLDKQVGSRPLTFIAHSLGGLVVKEMVFQSSAHEDRDHPHRLLADRVQGVVFLATPHSGSSLARLAITLGWVYGCTETVAYLRKNNATIEKLGDWFREYVQKHGVRVHTHRETKELIVLKFLKFFVVERGSANPGIRDTIEAVGKDHITICKCASTNDPVYRMTRAMVLGIAGPG